MDILLALGSVASEAGMMEKLIVQVPDLVALIVIVVLFLRNQEKRDHLIRELHTEHIESRKESRIIIEANTKIIGAILEDMKHFAEAVDRCQSRTWGESQRKK